MNGKTIWMTAAAAGRVQDEITENRKLLLKSTLVLSVMCRRRGHQSDVEKVRALHFQTNGISTNLPSLVLLPIPLHRPHRLHQGCPFGYLWLLYDEYAAQQPLNRAARRKTPQRIKKS